MLNDFVTDQTLPLTVSSGLLVMARLLNKAGKVRKGSGTSYLTHIGGVVGIISAYGGKNDTQLAGVFHDAVEDLGVSLDDIARVTNSKVAGMVAKVTEDKTKSWLERKAATEDLVRSCCQGVGIVLLADKIDNWRTTLREMPRSNDGFLDYWSRFNAGWKMQHDHLKQLTANFLLNRRLTDEMEYRELRTDLAINELRELFGDFAASIYSLGL